jgi:hypothetical protein
MPVSLSQTGDSHETILGTSEGEGWNIIVPVSATIVVEGVLVTGENGSHQDLTLDEVEVALSVVLGHDSSERVTSDEDLVTSESSGTDLIKSILDISIDKEWLWNVKEELWKTHPDLLTGLGSGGLNLIGEGGVARWIAVGAMDPNNGDLFSGGASRWRQDKDISGVGLSGGSSV